MTDEHVVQFVLLHEATWTKAFMGWRYRFTAPGLQRAPFQARRLNRLVAQGRLKRVGEDEGKQFGRLAVVR